MDEAPVTPVGNIRKEKILIAPMEQRGFNGSNIRNEKILIAPMEQRGFNGSKIRKVKLLQYYCIMKTKWFYWQYNTVQ